MLLPLLRCGENNLLCLGIYLALISISYSLLLCLFPPRIHPLRSWSLIDYCGWCTAGNNNIAGNSNIIGRGTCDSHPEQIRQSIRMPIAQGVDQTCTTQQYHSITRTPSIQPANQPTNHAESRAGLASYSNKKQSSIDFKDEKQRKRKNVSCGDHRLN